MIVVFYTVTTTRTKEAELQRASISAKEGKIGKRMASEVLRVLAEKNQLPQDHSPAGNVEVKPSLIQGAGNGLFASKRFEEGDVLCKYVGTPLTLAQSMKRTQEEKVYVMGGFGLNVRLDAGPHPEVLARFINDHSEESKLNATFVKIKDEDPWKCHANVVATRIFLIFSNEFFNLSKYFNYLDLI